MAKDFKSAFHNVVMQFANLHLLGIKVRGQFFIDNCLPFEVLVSCAVFKDITTLIHWMAERWSGHAMIHILDDFFTVHRLAYVCGSIMQSLKKVCKEIGMAVSPEKAVGPVQAIQFLGLMIDTTLMVIRVPDDKRMDILKMLQQMLHKRKATSLDLQSLAGKLNFLSKAVPAGRPFIQSAYQAFAGIPQNRHIDLKGNLLADLRMWKTFLLQFRGWQPIISKQNRAKTAIELLQKCPATPHWAGGAFLPSKKLWMFQQWDKGSDYQ